MKANPQPTHSLTRPAQPAVANALSPSNQNTTTNPETHMSKRKFTSFAIAATVATLIPAASANAHAALNRNQHRPSPAAQAIRAASQSRTTAPARAIRAAKQSRASAAYINLATRAR